MLDKPNMKTETISTFITAKTLFERAGELCVVDDKHMASAGIVILQDAIELVLYACLKELGVNKQKMIEKFSFDQMIGELKNKKCELPKSDTLKALNKQRVIIKHYGQVTDPTTALNYYESARHTVDSLMQSVVGKNLQDILIHEAIRKDEIKGYIAKANQCIEKKKYFDALVEIRKAVFIEIEQDYSVFDWRETPKAIDTVASFFEIARKEGRKAPWHTRNKEWIEENVHDPFDYIQLDHEKLRVDLLEWGVSTVDFWNLWRLTPPVFYDKKSSDWKVNLDLKYLREGATEENARYCLDRVVSLLVRKQNHIDLARYLNFGRDYRIKVQMKNDGPLFSKASSLSAQTNVLIKDQVYLADAIIPGLGGEEDFVHIIHEQKEEPKFLFGYVNFTLCQIMEE